jgi:putative peptidoglycan lipid II flippase
MTEPSTAAPTSAGAERGTTAAGGIATAAASIAAVAIVARLVGLARVFVMSNVLGTTNLGDTYLTANKLPNILFDIVAGGALASAVVPVLARPIASGNDEETSHTASAMLTWALLLLTPVAVVGMLASRPLMSLMLSATSDAAVREQKVEVGARMLVVFMPQVVLYGAGIVVTGVLQAHRRFLAPALGPLLSSVVVIGVYLMYGSQSDAGGDLAALTRGQELLLSLGTTMGVAALTLPLLFPLRRTGIRLRPRLRLQPQVARQIRHLALAGALALGAQQIASAVVLVLANRTEGGAVVYELAWTVFLVPWAVLAVPIATSAFPSMTEAVALGDEQRYGDVAAGALRGVIVVSTLSAALIAASAYPGATVMLRLFSDSGADSGVSELARALMLFAPGLVGYSVVALLSRALYARSQGWWPAAATAVGFGSAALLDVALAGIVADEWLVAAFGAGNTVGMTIAAALLMRAVRERNAAAADGVGVTALVTTVAAVLAGGVGALVANAFATSTGLRSVAAITAALVSCFGVYSAVIVLLRNGEARAVIGPLRRVSGWRR